MKEELPPVALNAVMRVVGVAVPKPSCQRAGKAAELP